MATVAEPAKKPRRKRRKFNKSAAIRAYLEKHPDAAPMAVAKAVSKPGNKVSPQLVSNIKHNMGAKKAKRGRPRKALASRKASENGLSLDHLLAAKKLVDQLGGVEVAVNAINALATLS